MHKGSKKGGYTTTNRAYVIHFGSMIGTVEVERMRDQQKILQRGTTARRGSEGNWRIFHGAG
jgi:hypothetical protein